MFQKIKAWYNRPRKSWLLAQCQEIIIIIAIAFAIRTCIFGLYQVPSGSMETTLLQGDRLLADKLSYWFREPKRGEIIAFNDPTYKYSDNSIISLFQRYVYGPSNWTKRIIGIPGDHIEGKIENNKPIIYLNGKKLDETGYVNKYPLVYTPRIDYADRSKKRIAPLSYDPSFQYNKQPFYQINPDLLLKDQFNVPFITEPETPVSNGKDIFDVYLAKDEYWVMGDNRLGSSDSRFWGPLKKSLIHGRIIFRIVSMDTEESWWSLRYDKKPYKFLE